MKKEPGFDAAIAFARDLIRIPGPPGAEGAVAARVHEELETLGFDDVWTDAVGNVLGRVRGRGPAPAVMVSSHLDVVDVGDPGSWEHPPFDAVVADGWLHGRGAMDIKGPLALQTYAAAALLNNRPDGDVIVAHTVVEERGGWGMSHLVEQGEVRPAAVILGEATNGDICIGHRGRAELIVELQGVAGHASAPERARNPVFLLSEVLPAVRAFTEHLPEHPLLGRASMAPTALETLPRSRNVIPDRVRLILDWRVLPGPTPEELLRELDLWLGNRVDIPEGFALDVRYATEAQRTYTGLERERRLFTPGFLLRHDHAVVQAAVQVVAGATGAAPAVRPWRFATDGGYTCGRAGIPTLGYAPGEERFAHTNTERLSLDQARGCFQAYPDLIVAVQKAAALEPAT